MNRNPSSFAVVVVAAAAVVAAAQESHGLRKMKQQTVKLRIPLALDMLWKIKSF